MGGMFTRSAAALRIASILAIGLGVQIMSAQQQTPAPPPGASVREPATVVPIQVTGDAASRFTLVVLADGYAAADMPQFRQDLDKHLNILWSIEPFRSYRNYFNVYAIEAVSTDSGLTCDPMLLEEPNMDPALRQKLQKKNTVFGLSFGGGCTNITARGVTPAGGMQAKVREYASRATANPDQILVIGNSRTYGGIGGALATSTGSNALSPLITPHEIGHSLGRLGDEYTYSARGRAGGTYSGGEPRHAHMTLLSGEAMKAEQKKWWRWLGEPSDAGGVIGRFEGGSGNTKGIWRPSKHSMMISLGYYFDQVGREQMVREISARVGLIAASTPTDGLVRRTDVLWINPAHPVYHQLEIVWKAGDRVMPNPGNLPYLKLETALQPGEETVSVTVTDPTTFVRDPAIRTGVLTQTLTWKVSSDRAPATVGPPPGATNPIGGGTQTQRPVGGQDVINIEASPKGDTTVFPLAQTTWRLDNSVVADAANTLSFPLAPRKLAPGTHRLSVTVGPPEARAAAGATRAWTIDNTMPTVTYELSKPVAGLAGAASAEPHTFMRDQFTMKLTPKDDQPGYLVAEFRVNGDGWHHYYGWPDAPPGTPYKFTARGTNIKELIYGSLSSEGLSPQPWEAREPGWGTHRVEYRGIDAAGNIGPARAFRVTVMPSPECATTVTGARAGGLAVESGVTCLDGATVSGNVTVGAGATLVSTNAKITGTVTATGAASIELVATTVDGALSVRGTAGRVTIFAATVGQDATVSGTTSPLAPLVIGNTIKGALTCAENASAPVTAGSKNAAKSATGQCGGQ
jgi:hypothetical protein